MEFNNLTQVSGYIRHPDSKKELKDGMKYVLTWNAERGLFILEKI